MLALTSVFLMFQKHFFLPHDSVFYVLLLLPTKQISPTMALSGWLLIPGEVLYHLDLPTVHSEVLYAKF